MKELKKESPDTKMIFSIGGFNHPDEPFSILVSNKTLRQAFIKNSIQFLRNSSFDGLDLFWYSPVYWNNDVKDHVEDKQNFLVNMTVPVGKYDPNFKMAKAAYNKSM